MLLSISMARSIWLFNFTDLNPRGKRIGPSIVTRLVQDYGFAQYPKTAEEMDETKGIQFLRGEFKPESGEPVEISLKIFNFGIVAETRSSTKDSDAFLEEVLGWISKQHDLPPYEEILRSKAYLSEMYIHSAKNLDLINPKLKHIIERLNTEVKGHGKVSYQTSAIAFWNDPSLNQPFPFRFERVAGVGFVENRYYSVAPLETENHLEILDDLEKILS